MDLGSPGTVGSMSLHVAQGLIMFFICSLSPSINGRSVAKFGEGGPLSHVQLCLCPEQCLACTGTPVMARAWLRHRHIGGSSSALVASGSPHISPSAFAPLWPFGNPQPFICYVKSLLGIQLLVASITPKTFTKEG